MVDLSGVDRKPAIIDRIKAIILTPRDEWIKIAGEVTTQGDILRSYVLPLAAIGPLAALIGWQAFGFGAFGFSYRPPLIGSVVSAVIQFVMSIVGVFVLALIADALAPKFEGQSNKLGAFKLVAYSYTAAWLAGIFGLIPSLAFFGLLGIYSFYLLYTGVTPLMKVPESKAAGYVAILVICAIVAYAIVGVIAARTTAAFIGNPLSSASSDVSGKVTIPGGGSLDLDKLQQATKQMEAAANGKTPPVAPDRMKALLPETIGAYQRTATEGVAAGPMGSTAQGTYTLGDKTFTLKISDMSALGALAGLGAAMGVEQSKEDANGYEKTSTVNGQIQTEAWNNGSHSGKYGVTINNRFMVEADGSANSVDELKQAVGSVDPDDLADLVG